MILLDQYIIYKPTYTWIKINVTFSHDFKVYKICISSYTCDGIIVFILWENRRDDIELNFVGSPICI